MSAEPTTSATYTGRVYVVKNTINEMVYIGSTTWPLSKRISCHRTKSANLNDQRKFYLAMRDLGVENFFIEELELMSYSDPDDLEKREFEWIAKYEPEMLYNDRLVYGKLSEEHKQKITGSNNYRFNRGSIYTDETQQRFRFEWREESKRLTKSFSWNPRSRVPYDREEAYYHAQQFRNTVFPLEE